MILQDYRNYLMIERRMSPNTVASYCHDVEAFLNSNGAATSSVTASDIESYLGSIKVSKRSSARILSALRSFFDWCVQEGQTKDNPAALVDSPKLGKYLPAVLSVDEVSAIMDSVDLKAPAGKRDRAILEVLYGCGLRVSEAASLRISKINFEDGFVDVIGKGDKQRLVPVHESLNELLNRYCSALGLLGDPEAFIFPGRNTGTGLSQSTAERHFKSILQHQGIIDADRDIHKRGPCLHCLRHCFMLSAFRQLEASGHTVDLAAPYLSIYCGHESLIESEKYLKFSSEMFVEEMAAFSMFSARLFPEVDL